MTIARRSAPVGFGSIQARTPLVGGRQRVGLLGGSFNPPHAAHKLITDIAMRRLGLDAVWWIVTPGNPLKSHHELAPLAKRLGASRTIERNPRVKITGLEQSLPSAYTAATLAFLKRRHRGVQFVWIMGADNLAGFHRWLQWRDIAALMPIAVVDRPGYRMRSMAGRAAKALGRYRLPESHGRRLAGRRAPAWVYLTGPLSPLSSTKLRASRGKAPR